MGINNYGKYNDSPKIVNELAGRNYNKFNVGFASIKEAGDHMALLTNIKDMRNKRDELILHNLIKQEDTEYVTLNGYIEQATKIQTDADPSLVNITHFYHIYNNVKDIYSALRGENFENSSI